MAVTLSTLLGDMPRAGEVRWLGVRPERKAEMIMPNAIELCTVTGILGDRYAGRSGNRHVTLIQHEHLACMASYLGIPSLKPEMLRRNISVSGINLLALKGKQFQVGDAVLAFTGLCHPCSAMQEAFGEGGYNAVRGHGGITARVIRGGVVRIGGAVSAADAAQA